MIVGVLVGNFGIVAAGVSLGVCVSDGFGVRVMVAVTVIVSVGIGEFVDVGAKEVLSVPQPTKNTIDRQKIRVNTIFNKDSAL